MYWFSVPPLLFQAARSCHTLSSQKSPLRSWAKGESQRRLKHGGLVSFPTSDSPAHFGIPLAFSTFSVHGRWCGDWERDAGRGNCFRAAAQRTLSASVSPRPQLLQHISTALDLQISELSLTGSKFLNKNLSSLYDMRIKLINGENYCIVKLQQWGHCDNYWIFIQLIFLKEF